MTVQQQLRFSGVDRESINALLQDYLDSAIEEETPGGNGSNEVSSINSTDRRCLSNNINRKA
jgi:hypothetical protein